MGDGKPVVSTPVWAILLTLEFSTVSGDPASRTPGAARWLIESSLSTSIVSVLAT